jgi:hypothetical protein
MKLVFIPAALLLLLSGCIIERRLYSPTQVNNPSLQKQNDYTASFTYSTPAGYDLNAGYALTNRLAVIAGLHNYKNKDEELDVRLFSTDYDSASLLYKHKGFHIGAGAFFPLSKNNPTIFLSFFGGLTKGTFQMNETFYHFPSTPPNPQLFFYKSDINRWFLQSSFNFYSKHIHQSFITRLNFVEYSNVSTNYSSNQQYSFRLPPFEYPRWSSFLDFAFDTKLFFSKDERIGIQFFGSITTRLKKEDFDFYIYPFRLGAGIVVKSPFTDKRLKK